MLGTHNHQPRKMRYRRPHPNQVGTISAAHRVMARQAGTLDISGLSATSFSLFEPAGLQRWGLRDIPSSHVFRTSKLPKGQTHDADMPHVIDTCWHLDITLHLDFGFLPFFIKDIQQRLLTTPFVATLNINSQLHLAD